MGDNIYSFREGAEAATRRGGGSGHAAAGGPGIITIDGINEVGIANHAVALGASVL
jgi:hypothetical protein